MSKECGFLPEDLTAFAFNELDGGDQARVEEHLKKCVGCRAELGEIVRIVESAGELPRLDVSAALHADLMRQIALEREAERMSFYEKTGVLAAFMGYRLKRSPMARFLFFAVAAQILILLTIVFASGLIVQKTAAPERPAVMEADRFSPAEEALGEFVLVDEEADRLRDPEDWVIDPPSIRAKQPFSLTPGDREREEEIELSAEELDHLDRFIEKENRLDLSRLGMYARLSVKCKNQVLNGRGGGRETELAVERGLRWLRDVQQGNGSWNPGGVHGGDTDAGVGITALCVASFLSGGHSEKGGSYSRTVRDGISFLLSQQDEHGRFGWIEGRRNLSVFNQSAATFALAENYILCHEAHGQALADAVRGLMGMCDSAVPGEGRDVGFQDAYVNTWSAMALRTSLVTGVQVRGLPEAAALADERVAYLARNETMGTDPVAASHPPLCTVTQQALDALFNGSYLTRKQVPVRDDPESLPLPTVNDAEILFRLLEEPDFREPSFLFFTGTALCEKGGKLWEKWNMRLKAILLEDQDRSGIWLVNGDWPGIDGGDVYTTALHLLTLQVYYRYINPNCVNRIWKKTAVDPQ